MTKRIWFLGLALLLSAVGGVRFTSAQEVTDCKTFASFDEANTYYAAHPEAASKLDDDADGTACEVYFGREKRTKRAQNTEPAATGVSQLAQKEKGDLDCEDFQTQEEAQAVLTADPSDPNNLDPNGDGVACALLPLAAELQADAGDSANAQTDESTNSGKKAKAGKYKNQEATTQEVATVSCADYATPKQAQKAFDKDPVGLAALDPDGNKIVCEETTQTTEAAPTPEPTATEEAAPRQSRKNKNNSQEASADMAVDQPPSVTPPEDIDCIDFQYQEEAQQVFNRDPTDPYNLDPNNDGFACSSLPSSMPITQVPNTGIGATPSGQETLLGMASMLMALVAYLERRRWRRRDVSTSRR